MDVSVTGWTYLPASGRVTDGPCAVWGFIVYPSSSGGRVTVYDGLDVGSGRRFAVLRCGVEGSTPFFFPKPVQFNRGLYVDFTSHVDGCTVLWEPSS